MGQFLVEVHGAGIMDAVNMESKKKLSLSALTTIAHILIVHTQKKTTLTRLYNNFIITQFFYDLSYRNFHVYDVMKCKNDEERKCFKTSSLTMKIHYIERKRAFCV